MTRPGRPRRESIDQTPVRNVAAFSDAVGGALALAAFGAAQKYLVQFWQQLSDLAVAVSQAGSFLKLGWAGSSLWI